MPRPRGEFIAKHKGPGRRAQYDVAPGPYDFLMPMLEDAGMIDRQSTMDGTVFRQLPWVEIDAWARRTGRDDLHPAWASAIRILSASFAAQLNASRDMECKAPFEPEDDI